MPLQQRNPWRRPGGYTLILSGWFIGVVAVSLTLTVAARALPSALLGQQTLPLRSNWLLSIALVVVATGTILWVRWIRASRLMSKAVTAALQTREDLAHRMAMIANQTDSALIITDCSGCIEWVNEGFTRMTGYAAAEVMGQRLLRILRFSANDPSAIATLLTHMRRGGGFKIDLANQTASGGRYLVTLEVQPLANETGGVGGYLVVGTDVTERARAADALRKAHAELEQRVAERTAELTAANHAMRVEMSERARAQEALRVSEEEYRATFEMAGIAKAQADPTTGRFLRVNRTMCELVGFSAEELQEMTFQELTHPDDRAESWQGFQQLLRPETESRPQEKRYVRKDGEVLWVHVNATILRDREGRPARSVAVIEDVTQRKLSEQRLAAVNQELMLSKLAAETATRAKSEFLANMSHEIRTPMNAILGYADLLLDPEQSSSDRLNCINTIRRNGDHLLTVINDVLDISKIEAGKMTVERVECEPSRIIADVTSLMRVRAAEKRLTLHVEYSGPIPRTIRSDPTRLRQILINLVSNAIKFTETGGVRICVKMINADMPASGATSRPLLQLEVVDSGIGMTAEQLKRLFTAFEQGDSSTTRRFGGTGLGLTISQRLAVLLGGTIAVESQLGRGSSFVCSVETGPLEGIPMLDDPHEAEAQAEAHLQPLAKMCRLQGSILLAEDGVDNQQLLSAYLRRAGCEVIIAGNGRIACEQALKAWSLGHPFDLILMDMQMPELDGYGAASMLRAKGYTGPIIALTAHAMPEDRQKCLQSGCSDYLTKPISRQTLLEGVARHLNCAVTDAAPSLIRSAAPADDEVIRQHLPRFIDQLPVQVEKLLDLLQRQELAELSKVLHQLKGTGGLFGFMSISHSAALAEQAAKAAEIESITERMQALVSLVRRVEGYDRRKENLRRLNCD